MSPLVVVGVDPGATTGLCLLEFSPQPGAHLLSIEWDQVHGSADTIGWLTARGPIDFLAVEDFVVGRRAGRSMTASGGKAARDVIAEVLLRYRELPFSPPPVVTLRPAGLVKPWATDARLRWSGLYLPRARHARDAARHAMFDVVKRGLAPDPLTHPEMWWR